MGIWFLLLKMRMVEFDPEWAGGGQNQDRTSYIGTNGVCCLMFLQVSRKLMKNLPQGACCFLCRDP